MVSQKTKTTFPAGQILVAFFSLTLVILTFVFSWKEMTSRLSYELEEVYTYDNSLYSVVGRGIFSGKRVYLDFYENKPPMIFFLSGLSFQLWGNYRLLNILCFLSLINLIVFPVLFAVLQGLRKKYSWDKICLLGAMVLPFSLLLALYGAKRSGEAQVEIFGAANSVLCLFFLYLLKDTKIKIYNPLVILAGFFLGMAVGFKEPFGVLICFLMLLSLKKKADLLGKFLYPLFYGIFFFFLLLLVCRALPGYFTVYLPTMLFSHISTYGSPFTRMWNLAKIVKDLRDFSFLLPYAILIVLLAAVVLRILPLVGHPSKTDIALAVKDLLVVILGIWVSSLLVGLGGQYYNHHFVFALPYYDFLALSLALFLPSGSLFPVWRKKEDSSPALALPAWLNNSLLALLALTTAVLPLSTYHKDAYAFPGDEVMARTTEMKEKAAYVYALLDTIGEETYLYIGFNGWTPYMYSKHLPMGPIFAQDSDLFQDETNFYVTNFRNELHSADVIVLDYYNVGVIKDEVETYVQTNFTSLPPKNLSSLKKPVCFTSQVLYRK